MMSVILRFFASDVVARGIAVLFIPVFSYLLGPTQLGLFSEWFALYNVFAAVVALGVPSFVLVLLSREPEAGERVNRDVLRFFAEWCVVVGVLNLGYLVVAPDLVYGLGLYLAGVMFAIVNYAAAILRHQQQFGRYLQLQLALAAATSMVPAIWVYYAPNWEARALGYSGGLVLLALVVCGVGGIRIARHRLSWAFRREALGFGSSIALMSGLAWFKLGGDVQFLKWFSGYSASGILFFAFQVVSVVSIIAASLNRSSAPSFYRLIHESRRGDFVALVVRLSGGLGLLALATVALAWLLVNSWLADFRDAMFLVYPMTAGAVIYGAGQFIASQYLYSKKPQVLTWCVGLSSIFHPLVSYLLVSGAGWHWIGWSYLASSCLFLVLVGVNLYRVREAWETS